jgi:predicted dehydrogenase
VTLRIGLIGCGRWGRYILRDLLALGATVEVAARSVANRREALVLGAARAVGSIDSLSDPIDGFVVASPTATHADVITLLLPSGRPIFVEKPMTNDVATARHIASIAGERVFVMDKWRYHPGIEGLAAAARAGELGSIEAIRSYRLGLGHPHTDVDGVWVLLPHDLSIALEILGYLPAARAAWTPVPGRQHSELIALLADGPDTLRVTIEIGTIHPAERRSVLVVGTKKVAQLGGSYDDRIIMADRMPNGQYGNRTTREAIGELPLLRELRAFLDHLRGGAPPRSSAAEGLLVIERIAALRQLAGLS